MFVTNAKQKKKNIIGIYINRTSFGIFHQENQNAGTFTAKEIFFQIELLSHLLAKQKE